MLVYLGRYSHLVVIPNSQLISVDVIMVAISLKDYPIKSGDRMKVMWLNTDALILRFLILVLSDSVRRIRHRSQPVSALRKTNIAKIRTLRGAELIAQENTSTSDIIPRTLRTPCPNCGEVCQRGAHSHQAETTRNGPHRKTLIRPGIRCAERE